MENGIGRPVRRFEDLRMLRGRGRYSDDYSLPGQAYIHVTRSPHAHAHIRAIEVGAARAAPGVLAVLTAAEYEADGLAPIPHPTNPLDALDPSKPALVNRDGTMPIVNPYPPLANDRVRAVGEPVTVVVAETPEQARDAGELVEVAYEPLPAVTDVAAAARADAPLLWDNVPGNVAADCEWGERAAVGAAFARAHHVVDMELRNNRVVNAQMEPRAAVAEYDEAAGRYTIHAGTQNPHRMKMELSRALGVDRGDVRVVTHDVGGGYGPRMWMYPEFVFVAWAAKRLGRPVKWTSTRSEAFVSDFQARDQLARAALALDENGRILAMRAEILY